MIDHLIVEIEITSLTGGTVNSKKNINPFFCREYRRGQLKVREGRDWRERKEGKEGRETQ